MSGVKHTPGPWRTNGCYISSNYGEVGHAYFVSSMPEGMADANAYLMAAAPDLLEACKEFLPILERQLASVNLGGIADGSAAVQTATARVERMRAAITRATGDRPEKGGA